MNIPKQYIVFTVLLVASFSAGRFLAPRSIQTKSEEHAVTRTDESTTRNQNVVETTKETRLPDGTTIKETRKEKESNTQKEVKTDSQTSKVSTQTIEVRPGYRLGVVYEPAVKGFQKESGSLILERRLFSEIYMGVSVSSNQTVGLTVSLGF